MTNKKFTDINGGFLLITSEYPYFDVCFWEIFNCLGNSLKHEHWCYCHMKLIVNQKENAYCADKDPCRPNRPAAGHKFHSNSRDY